MIDNMIFKENKQFFQGFLLSLKKIILNFLYPVMILKVKGTAVGFMSVCSKVDVELLSSCFDLKPFNGLQKLQGQTPGKFAINLSIIIFA